MKKYVLVIKYAVNKEEIEYIEESLFDESEVSDTIVEDSILVDKCISQFYNTDSYRYDELMKLGKQSGFIIGDA
tara:strand:- start:328 stop:549 length:222 start_codon:yes stop_codon:yes gene_type:complete